VIRIQPIESEGWATAFLINHERQKFWITAKHVFEKKTTNKAKIFISNNESVEFSIIDFKFHDAQEVDLASFQIGDDFPLKNLKGLNYCIPNYDCYGNDVYCLGFPYNASITKKKDIPCIKKGILNSIGGDTNFLVDKMVARGFSGGPVLMEYAGEYNVIGVISNGSFQNCYALATMRTNGVTRSSQNANSKDRKDLFSDNEILIEGIPVTTKIIIKR
jgi:hypothetical protein